MSTGLVTPPVMVPPWPSQMWSLPLCTEASFELSSVTCNQESILVGFMAPYNSRGLGFNDFFFFLYFQVFFLIDQLKSHFPQVPSD